MCRSFVIFRLLAVVSVIVVAAGCGGKSPTQPSAPYSQTDLVVGTGAVATIGSRVVVGYAGWLCDPTKAENKGKQFDSSSGFTFTVGVGGVIKGWDQGVPGMRVGGSRRLVIPPELAYGSAGAGNGAIPPNATLVFDVMLISVL
jgi:FKBP-type peptidyl-prolyl cis-trans isomerase FkpA